MTQLLFVADVIGSPGRDALRALLPELRRRHDVHLVICNCENSAAGFGVSSGGAGTVGLTTASDGGLAPGTKGAGTRAVPTPRVGGAGFGSSFFATVGAGGTRSFADGNVGAGGWGSVAIFAHDLFVRRADLERAREIVADEDE